MKNSTTDSKNTKNTTTEEIDAIAEALWEHWVLHRRIDAEVATEMRQELTEHLSDAHRDGKSLETVTGKDLRAFADEWAESRGQDRGLSLTEIGGIGLLSVVMVLGTSIAMEWVIQRSAVVTVSLFESLLLSILSMGLVWIFLLPSSSRARRKPQPLRITSHSLLWGCGFSVFIASAAFFGHRFNITLLEASFPWWVAVCCLAVIIAFLIGLPLWASRQTTD